MKSVIFTAFLAMMLCVMGCEPADTGTATEGPAETSNVDQIQDAVNDAVDAAEEAVTEAKDAAEKASDAIEEAAVDIEDAAAEPEAK